LLAKIITEKDIQHRKTEKKVNKINVSNVNYIISPVLFVPLKAPLENNSRSVAQRHIEG
jgi:hypothetical protein